MQGDNSKHTQGRRVQLKYCRNSVYGILESVLTYKNKVQTCFDIVVINKTFVTVLKSEKPCEDIHILK